MVEEPASRRRPPIAKNAPCAKFTRPSVPRMMVRPAADERQRAAEHQAVEHLRYDDEGEVAFEPPWARRASGGGQVGLSGRIGSGPSGLECVHAAGIVR